MGREDEKMATSREISRRDERDSRGKRHSSRPEREPSPKRSRRDGKPATERPYSGSHRLETDGATDHDQKNRRRLHDALPLEIPSATDTKVKPDVSKIDPDRKVDRIPGATKDSSDPADVPRSRSYFQHDLRSSAGQGGRNHDFRATDHRRWDEQRDRSGDRVKDKESADLLKKDKTQSGRDENNSWRHDGFFELEGEVQPARKRRPFTEKKRSIEREPAATGTESEYRHHQALLGSARREQREIEYSRKIEKSENPFYRDDEKNEQNRRRFLDRVGASRTSYQSRDRYGARGMRGGRERYSRRYGDSGANRPTERQWKHDGFDEVNRSPVSKNTEEQIAKIEALLAL